MFFTKEVRSQGERPYGRKDFIASTDDENTDLGVLETKNRQGKQIVQHLQESLLPDVLILKCKIQGVPLQHKTALMGLHTEGRALPMIPFYGEQILEKKQRGHCHYSVHEAVNLLFTGKGYCSLDGKDRTLEHADFNLSATEKNILLTKQFKVQTGAHLVQRQRRLPNGDWSVTLPRGGASLLKTLPFIAYGGYVKPGAPLDQITQIFGTLEKAEIGKGYKLHLRSQKDLEEMNILIPQGGWIQETAYAFNEIFFGDEKLSLAGLIDVGKARVDLFFGEEERASERYTYESFKYEQQDPATGTVDLYFKAQ
ncbi:MAG: hypothetical protein H2057_02970 [Alphaproteobacteria bacterium]|nr:hypothetical protein [Alphaproteobacteria bacterium]